MAEYFQRANLLQGVSPISAPGVQVPLKNPALAAKGALFSDISQRVDQFAAVAFKKGAEIAKIKGTQYGAKHAPTLDQIINASITGLPIEIKGDATGNILQQAAYAGSLAKTESQIMALGRRTLTNYMAHAAQDPSLKPEKFAQQANAIVVGYTNAMMAISPTSAQKINSSLGIVANSQLTSFSRTWMTNQKKEENILQVNI